MATTLEDLVFQFDEISVQVSQAVKKRTEQFRQLEKYVDKAMKLQTEESESGLNDLDDDDPLRFIESEYSFFQDMNNCDLEDIGNIEDPRKCIVAMDKFVQIIQENIHRFKHMPLGPLFDNVLVKRKKWAPLIEHVLRPYMFSFLVDNIVDGLVMEELIAQHFPGSTPGIINKEGIVCPKFHVYDFNSKHELDSRITSVTGMELENMAESLVFNTDVWAQFLSKIMKMEKIVFIDTENAAFLVMSHIQNTPWHCHLAYTLDGFKVHPFPCFQTKKIVFFPKTMYIKTLMNLELGEVRGMIKRMEQRIRISNQDIRNKREKQLELAIRIDDARRFLARDKKGTQVQKAKRSACLNKDKKLNKTFLKPSSK